MTQEIESFESDLIKEINELKLNIRTEDTKSALKMISPTTPFDCLSL